MAWVLYETPNGPAASDLFDLLLLLDRASVRIAEQPLRAERDLKIPRGLAILLVYLAIGLLLFLTIRFISPMMIVGDDLKENWPN